jgi:hypothetical protein
VGKGTASTQLSQISAKSIENQPSHYSTIPSLSPLAISTLRPAIRNCEARRAGTPTSLTLIRPTTPATGANGHHTDRPVRRPHKDSTPGPCAVPRLRPSHHPYEVQPRQPAASAANIVVAGTPQSGARDDMFRRVRSEFRKNMHVESLVGSPSSAVRDCGAVLTRQQNRKILLIRVRCFRSAPVDGSLMRR